MRTRTKIVLAGMAQRVIMIGRRLCGKGPIVTCRRGGIKWRLDLQEGIDFSIFLLGAFEPSTRAAYRRIVAKGAVVIDIGANIGAHSLPLAAHVGPSGLVIAVEPTKYAFDKMKVEISLNEELKPRIRAHQAMLMANGETALVDALSSSWPLFPPDGAHEQHLGVSKGTEGATVATLDGLVEKERLQKVDFIKLDVDGYEIEVLRGAQNVLKKFKPTIIFEHAPYSLEEMGYPPDGLIKSLTESGYLFTDLDGRPFGRHGSSVPDVPVGSSVNVIALPNS